MVIIESFLTQKNNSNDKRLLTTNIRNCGFVLNSKFVPLKKHSAKPKIKCFKVRNYAYSNRYNQ